MNILKKLLKKIFNDRDADGDLSGNSTIARALAVAYAMLFAGWAYTGLPFSEYDDLLAEMFEIGNWLSLGIAGAFVLVGVIGYGVSFIIAVTHDHFGIPNFVYKAFFLMCNVSLAIAAWIVLASFFTVINKLIW